MALREYRRKRIFDDTPEPSDKQGARGGRKTRMKALVFVVQKHRASHLHYDLRLEMGGVLKSWAVPRGPSLDPAIKRLAMHVEDHPYDYKDFEGVIPEGNYGAGRVIVWDQGAYASAKKGDSEEELLRDLKQGHLSIVLLGKKLKGEFALIRTAQEDKAGKKRQWLLIKAGDAYASKKDVTKNDRSVISKRRLAG